MKNSAAPSRFLGLPLDGLRAFSLGSPLAPESVSCLLTQHMKSLAAAIGRRI
ncbi:MAG: hypothetical protein JSR77_10960 [Planctomycetes bacterium]|nr:hypothetical protein [Planctomycetota bacterium]